VFSPEEYVKISPSVYTTSFVAVGKSESVKTLPVIICFSSSSPETV